MKQALHCQHTLASTPDGVQQSTARRMPGACSNIQSQPNILSTANASTTAEIKCNPPARIETATNLHT
jgi:hypothetical protein